MRLVNLKSYHQIYIYAYICVCASIDLIYIYVCVYTLYECITKWVLVMGVIQSVRAPYALSLRT